MSKLSKPEVVGLLVHQGRQRQRQWITPFDVKLLSKGGLTTRSREGLAIELLIGVMILIFLPVWVEIKPIGSGRLVMAKAFW
jgi:hypothetical protein